MTAAIRDVTGRFMFASWPYNSFINPQMVPITLRCENKDLQFLSTTWEQDSVKPFIIKYCGLHDNKKYILSLFMKYPENTITATTCSHFQFNECYCLNFGECILDSAFSRATHRSIVEVQINPSHNYSGQKSYVKVPMVNKIHKKRGRKLKSKEHETKKIHVNPTNALEVKIPQSSDTETDVDIPLVPESRELQKLSPNKSNESPVIEEENQNRVLSDPLPDLEIIAIQPNGKQNKEVTSQMDDDDSDLKIREPAERKSGTCSIVDCTAETTSLNSRHCLKHGKTIQRLREKERKRKERAINTQNISMRLSFEQSLREIANECRCK